MQLTPSLSGDVRLELTSQRALPTGALEIFYTVS
jgi:hypothetical protein